MNVAELSRPLFYVFTPAYTVYILQSVDTLSLSFVYCNISVLFNMQIFCFCFILLSNNYENGVPALDCFLEYNSACLLVIKINHYE